jgi:glycosyltransferase involved in cell wall biosynthesis
MVGRNSAKLIGQGLASIVTVVDEIVYVDTGSSDETKEIAIDYGAKVCEFAWCNDFSKARNFGIEHAQYEWIWAIDTDEVLSTPNARELVLAATANPSYPAYLIFQDNLYCWGGEIRSNPLARLFRNDPRIRFRNPVHECVSENILTHWPGVYIPQLDIHVSHYGYLPENIVGKHDRNFELLQDWLRLEPEHLFCQYKLGQMLLERGRVNEALALLRRTFERLASSRRERETAPFLATFMLAFHRCLKEAELCDEADQFEALANEWLEERSRDC